LDLPAAPILLHGHDPLERQQPHATTTRTISISISADKTKGRAEKNRVGAANDGREQSRAIRTVNERQLILYACACSAIKP
jgi:hypothetical protein